MSAMIFGSMWRWWYVHGWQAAAKSLLQLLGRVAEMFSVPILLKTLLAPWKQTVNVPGPNTPLNVRAQWWLGNQISRVVGFGIRLLTIIAAGVTLGLILTVGGLLLLSWYLLPPLVVVLLVAGVLRL